MNPYPMMLNPLQILTNASYCERCGLTSAAIEIEKSDDPLELIPKFKLAEALYCRNCGYRLPEVLSSPVKAALARKVASALQLPATAPKALPPAPDTPKPKTRPGPATEREKAELLEEAKAEVNGHTPPKKPKPKKKQRRGFGSIYRPALPSSKIIGMPPWGQRGQYLPDGNYRWIKATKSGPVEVIIDPNEVYRSEIALIDYAGGGLRGIFTEARDSGVLECLHVPASGKGREGYEVKGDKLIDWLEKLEKIGREKNQNSD